MAAVVSESHRVVSSLSKQGAPETEATPAPLSLVSTRARVRWALSRSARCLALVIAFCAAACLIGLSPVNTRFENSSGGTEVFVYTDHLQSKIVMPVKCSSLDWGRAFPPDHFAAANEAEYEYLAFSWGDREFSLNTPAWGDANWFTALKAVLVPTDAAMRVERCPKPEKSPGYRRITLSNKEYSLLTRHVIDSFDHAPGGKVRRLDGRSAQGQIAYYQANGKFYFLNTGNNWTGACLKRAGVRTGMWTPFTVGLAQVSD